MSGGPGRGAQDRGARARIGAATEYFDVDGTRWCVTEHDMRDMPGARGPRCLLFASRYVVRRVWTFPAEWRTLAAPSLAALSWER